MGKTYVLDRVATDLARGLTHPAIQRLSSLVAAYPTDLDLRRRLAAVHRRVGNRIQAGRWDYLTIGADADDTSAFERAFPSAVTRLRAVRWPGTVSAAPTSYARSRLAKLTAAADAERPSTAVAPRVAAQPQAAPSRPYATRPTATGADAIQRALRGQWAELLHSAQTLLRSLRPSSAMLLAVAAGVAATLIAVGAATVIEWIIL